MARSTTDTPDIVLRANARKKVAGAARRGGLPSEEYDAKDLAWAYEGLEAELAELELGPRTAATLQEQWQESRYRADDSLVFCHPSLGSPLDPSKLSRGYMRPALRRAKIEKPFRPWHDLRHTALTHEAAAGNPQAYVQLKAGHSQGAITERYIHAAQVLWPGAAARGEERMFGAPNPD
jgi:hypothetical protein